MAYELFGFKITRKQEENDNIKSFVEPPNEEGALNVTAAGGAVSSYLDMEGTARSEAQLVQRYRSMYQQPEVEQAIDDIVNEAINITEDEKSVECVTDDLELSDNVKKRIRDEFDEILKLLDFSNQGYDIFQKWYIDGRMNYHIMIDEANPSQGIKELRYVDSRKLRKIREYERSNIGTAGNTGFVKKIKNEYYIYNEKGFDGQVGPVNPSSMDHQATTGLRIAKDSIVHCNSGLMNENNTLVLSHIHRAYKPLNQLRMMEDAVVIYRLVRAPERRVFYIDVGNLTKIKAEQYIRDMMAKHKNRLVYDINTGEVRDDRRHISMTDDFWLPRREGGRGTQIDTLQAGENLGNIEDIVYFQRRLFKSLKVPITRLDSETGFSLGRSNEITRDEVKFGKFIRRLRIRFSILFDRILEKQLILKGIITPDEWASIQQALRYDFKSDNYFEELKQAEILRERLTILRDVNDYVGKYYSKQWVRSKVLYMSEDEIDTIKKEIEMEKKEEPDPEEDGNSKFR